MSPTIVACGSRIESVVVYARGAVVSRRVELPEALPEGAVELRVAGITALADAGSVRAICEGEREVTALSAALRYPTPTAPPGSLAERLAAIELHLRRLRAEQQSTSELRQALAEAEIAPALPRWARRLDPAARFADAAALHGLLDEELGRLDAAIAELGVAVEDQLLARAAAQLEASQARPEEIAGEHQAQHEVAVRFAAGAGKIEALAIEYVVGAARWWPAYTARFSDAATKVALTLDALVAQASGEDWGRVRLALSTAHLANDARLPELPSLRLGRAQAAPRRGYRPPPPGLDALFAGYDRAVAEQATSTREPTDTGAVDGRRSSGAARWEEQTKEAETAAELGMLDDDLPSEISLQARDMLAAAPMARPEAAPMRKMSAPAPEKARRAFGARGAPAAPGGGGAPLGRAEPAAPAEPLPIEPADAWLDFDTLVLADPGDTGRRGRLVREPQGPLLAEAARTRIDLMATPPLAHDPLSARGRYDHRYDAAGTADIPSSGRPHRVSVGAAETHAVPRFVAVPREAAEVYREAELQNPFDAPLLAGPVDVFLDGALMTTAELGHVDRRGALRLGLGVEDRLRVARNARVEESTAGLLGGSLLVDHAVTVELASSLGRKVTVEVLERVPFSGDKDVEVKLTYARPEPERYTQAERGAPVQRGQRFLVEVPAGEKAKVELGYRVTLPAKNEIIGGNRRE